MRSFFNTPTPLIRRGALLLVRLDKQAGGHRTAYERNKKVIFKTQNTCGICGHLVDFGLKSPHPMSASIDHIIPVSKNGHPSDISNLQLAHRACNRQKADKVFSEVDSKPQVIGNRNLPQSLDWTEYNNKKPIKNKTIIKIKRRNIGG